MRDIGEARLQIRGFAQRRTRGDGRGGERHRVATRGGQRRRDHRRRERGASRRCSGARDLGADASGAGEAAADALRDRSTGRAAVEDPEHDRDLALSPDGTHLVYVEPRRPVDGPRDRAARRRSARRHHRRAQSVLLARRSLGGVLHGRRPWQRRRTEEGVDHRVAPLCRCADTKGSPEGRAGDRTTRLCSPRTTRTAVCCACPPLGESRRS